MYANRLRAQGIINGIVAYGLRVARHDDIDHGHKAADCPACPKLVHGTIMERAEPNQLWIPVQWDNLPTIVEERRYELNRVGA